MNPGVKLVILEYICSRAVKLPQPGLVTSRKQIVANIRDNSSS